MTSTIISHSEVETFTLCERRHYYAFGERLTRQKQSKALSRAILGHYLLLEVFFAEFQKTGDFDHSLQELDMAIMQSLVEVAGSGNDMSIVHDLARIIKGWLEHHRDIIQHWKIVSIEETKKLDMGSFVFAFTTDLVVIENGHRTIIDAKFVYDMYNGDLLDLLPQLPRYVGAERAMGLTTRFGKYAFIRHRSLKNPTNDDLYRLQKIEMSSARIKNSFKDVLLALNRIVEFRKMPLQEWQESVTRVASIWVCKTCPFKDLCASELNGSDGILIRATQYEKSTYGYQEITE